MLSTILLLCGKKNIKKGERKATIQKNLETKKKRKRMTITKALAVSHFPEAVSGNKKCGK